MRGVGLARTAATARYSSASAPSGAPTSGNSSTERITGSLSARGAEQIASSAGRRRMKWSVIATWTTSSVRRRGMWQATQSAASAAAVPVAGPVDRRLGTVGPAGLVPSAPCRSRSQASAAWQLAQAAR